MKILSLYYQHKPGGFCKRLYRAHDALIEGGDEVHYVCLDTTPHSLATLHTIPFPPIARSGVLFWCLFVLWAPLYILGITLRYRVEHVLAFGAIYSALTLPARIVGRLFTGRKIPSTLFIRSLVSKINRVTGKGKLVSILSTLLERIGLASATTIVAMTESMRSALCVTFKLSPSSIQILPNEIAATPPVIESQNSASPLKTPLKILCAGVFDERKNGSFLLHTLIELEKTYPHALELQMIGTGPLVRELQVLSKNLTATSVQFIDWVEDLTPYLQRADLIVHPSLHEGISNVVLEGLAAGKPVLLSDIPEHRELLPLHDALFSLTSSQELQERISKLVKTPSARNDLVRQEMALLTPLFFDWKERVRRILHSEKTGT